MTLFNESTGKGSNMAERFNVSLDKIISEFNLRAYIA